MYGSFATITVSRTCIFGDAATFTNKDCRVLFGDIFIVPFLGSALGYLIAMCSPGWGNLVAFDWNDLPVGRKFDGKFFKHVKSPPNPLPPPGRLYIDRCISLLSSRRHVIWHDSVFCGFWVRVVNQSVRVFFNRAFSSGYAILKSCNNSRETAAYATTPLCFEFFRCRVDVLTFKSIAVFWYV